MEVMQAYDATNKLHVPPLQALIASPIVMPSVLLLFDFQDFLPLKEISPPKHAKTPVESSIPVSPSSSVGSSSPVSNCALTDDALYWWNANAQPIRIEQANKITWTELKRLLTNKYCPRTEVKKIEDEFYNLVLKGNDLKTYIRRFQELAVLCPNMVPNSKKLREVFIGGLPRSIEGNVTASKP
nr:reverse transcriptase domain-containing protein [Tanacetum cinerariifolium]